MSTELEKIQQEKAVSYKAFGSEELVRLTAAIIRNYYAKPATNGEQIDDANCFKFMALCRARRLNPAEGDAFAVGYLNQREGKVTWSLITAHNAFLKRAEANAEFEGMTSGVIVWPPWDCGICEGKGFLLNFKENDRRKCPECGGRKVLDELEGDFYHPETKDGQEVKLVGGWAKVFRKGKIVTYRRLALVVFKKNYGQWLTNDAGMIVKCAEADALRSTFPTILGGMFIEPGQIDAGAVIDISEAEPEKRPQLGLVPAPTKPRGGEKRAQVQQPEPEKGQGPVPTQQSEPPVQQTEPPTQQSEPAEELVVVPAFASREDDDEETIFKRLVEHVKECAKSVKVDEKKLVEFAVRSKLAGPKVTKIGEISTPNLRTIANSYQQDPLKWKALVEK